MKTARTDQRIRGSGPCTEYMCTLICLGWREVPFITASDASGVLLDLPDSGAPLVNRTAERFFNSVIRTLESELAIRFLIKFHDKSFDLVIWNFTFANKNAAPQ